MDRKYIPFGSAVISPVAGELYFVFLYLCVLFYYVFFLPERAFGLELDTDLVSCSKPSLLGGLNNVSKKSEGGAGNPQLDLRL